jgi:sugar phosphate isomerase/epimerase
MRLTFITDEATQDLSQAINLAKQLDLEAIELRTVHGKSCSVLTPHECQELKAILTASEMRVCCVSSPVYKCSLRGSLNSELELEKLQHAIRVAEILECPYVRIFSFWRDNSLLPSDGAIIENMDLAADCVRGKSVKLLIENGRRTCHATASELVGLSTFIDLDCIRFLWDPANPIFGGIEKDPLDRNFIDLIPLIAHVHVKDPIYESDSNRTYVRFGEGQLDIPKLLHTLRAHNYNGFLSVESHWRTDRQFTPEELDIPGGYEFSRNGTDSVVDSIKFLRMQSDKTRS